MTQLETPLFERFGAGRVGRKLGASAVFPRQDEAGVRRARFTLGDEVGERDSAKPLGLLEIDRPGSALFERLSGALALVEVLLLVAKHFGLE